MVNQSKAKAFRSLLPIKPKKLLGLTAVALSLSLSALGIATALQPQTIQASDHDDGDIDVRSRSLSLTDLYAFRETDLNPAARPDDLIFVMNTNPRSLARQQYFFSSEARYEFRFSRVRNNDATPTATPDTTLRFTFGRPQGSNRRQKITITVLDSKGTQVVDKTVDNKSLFTTSLNNSPTINTVAARGSRLTVFAGLREDPFYFDVEQFFRVRAGLAGLGPAVGFRPPEQAVDFATGYNVNTVVVRVPRRFLQGESPATTFDVWLSLLVQDPRTKQFVQTEQLARPGINEVLLISQGSLAGYNRTQPSRVVPPSVAAEATNTLLALGNSPERATALLGAFIPDVMRFDTTGPSGFANALNAQGSPIRGRMLTDDVVDIALSVLSNGAVTTDNVSYEGVSGNPGQGHDPLDANFPYLALPN
ncbi:MAG: DUF4331 domain-containing protein [Pegethrix bostrychoides GSE-TBD4-15B]|jgi:hypothetical protein|uniref:DUF4331 domain-containing protein n=1 Tax=Pegethrix bostrychoides GSE-TBD4-15B TaxID=2839662 RepID=A0A951P705_9CYAN|nr:DUF4331 domain-containing protein [Pegethrix bostrychoides GSE-TBD4-15B]